MSTILIAYERELEQMALEKLLIERGHTIVRSNNGVDALEAARREPPQLMISDILLPKMDGFALCKKWKQDERLQSVPFVFYTRRHDDPKYERFALELGVDRYLERTTDSTALLKGVDELLAQGVSQSRPDTMRLQALSTGIFTTTGRFAMTQPVPVHVPTPHVNGNASATAANSASVEDATSPANGEDRSLAREARVLARVTELDAQNKQLQASEQRFRHLFEASPIPMWLVNADDRQCVAVNQAALALYGFARDEFMQLPRNAPPFAAGAVIAGTSATWHRTKSGAAIAVELHSRAVELGVRRGEIYAAYDFTQRVFSHQATAHAADAYQSLLVAAPDGILLLDENYALIDANEAYCRMSGYDRDELLKLSMHQLETCVGEEPQTRFAQWRATEHAGHVGADKSRYESRHIRKDGSQYSVEAHIGCLTGAKPRTVVSIRDNNSRAQQREAEVAKHHEEQRLQTSRAKVLQHALLLHRMALVADEAAIVRRAVEFAAEITESPLAYACSTDPSQITAQLLAIFDKAYGPATTIELEKGKMSPRGPSAQCMRSGQPLFVTDKKQGESHDLLMPQGTALVLPILDGDKALGAVAVANRATAYGSDDRLFLTPLVESLSAILQSKRAHAHTAMLAQTAEMALRGLVANLGSQAEKK